MGLAATSAIAGLTAGCNEPSPPSDPKQYSPFIGMPKADRPNIILFVSDTLRADHLSCYGRTPQTSPVVDSLAAEGVLFERCISGSTWTKPSIGTMYSGVPARVHQAVAATGDIREIIEMEAYKVQVLRDEFLTLAEALKQVGYSNAYFIGNGHGRPEFGYGRGFDHVKYESDYFIGTQISDAIEWIWSEASEPFFIVIHQIDPHGPYMPTEDNFFDLHGVTLEEASQVMDPDEAEKIQRHLEFYGDPKARAGMIEISDEANAYLAMLYDAEIYTVDSHLKRLISHLKRIDVFDNTVLTFTSDHGEGFREHRFFGHGASWGVQELLHVPLIMAGGGLPKGARVPQSVSMIDLYPTLLELAGGTPPDYVTGSPLLSRSGDILVKENRLTYTDLDFHEADLNVWDACIFDGQYKVASRKRANKHYIFDLLTDPGELNNLWGSGEISEEMERTLIARLEAEVERYDTLRQQFGEPVWMEAADGVHEELQALGYL
jgi:arylsulfatase A-like enzyme